MPLRHATLLLVLPFVAASAPGADLRELYKRTHSSVVLLRTYDRLGANAGQGTGFLVGGGLIVTNFHVIDGARSVEALGSADHSFRVAALLASDEENDIAILRPEPVTLPPLSLSQNAAAVGQRVIVLGNPLGLAKTLSEGVVSALREDGLDSIGFEQHRGAPLLQITAPISPGSSGSPVMDEEGRVVGVVSSAYVRGQNLNFAVPASVVAALVSGIRPGEPLLEYGSVPSSASLTRNLVISGIVLGVFGGAAYLVGRRRSRARINSRTLRGPTVKSFRDRA